MENQDVTNPKIKDPNQIKNINKYRKNGFFIKNKDKYAENQDFIKNKMDWRQAQQYWEANKDNKTAQLAFIIPSGTIVIDADNEKSANHIDLICEKLGIQPYSYLTNPRKKNKHFWFKIKTKNICSSLITPLKLNSSSGALHITMRDGVELSREEKIIIDTRGCRTEGRGISTKVIQGQVFLKNAGKVSSTRPSPNQLLEGLKTAPEIPISVLISAFKVDRLRSSDNLDHDSLPVAGRIKRYLNINKTSLPYERMDAHELKGLNMFIQLCKEQAMIHNHQYDFKSALHKWVDANPVGITISNNEYEKKFSTIKFYSYGTIIYADKYNNGNLQELNSLDIKKLAKKQMLNSMIMKDKKLTSRTIEEFAKKMVIDSEEIKTVTDKIIFNNGYINLDDFSFVKGDFIGMNKIYLDYKTNHSKQIWEIHKEFIKPYNFNQDTQKRIYLYLGSAISPTIIDRDIICFIGDGKNGKSTLIDFMSNIAGDHNSSSVSLKQIQDSDHSYSGLINKTLNAVADADYNDNRNLDLIKKLSGGDSFHANPKMKDGFTFKPIATNIFSMNEVPNWSDGDKSDGLTSRMKFIHFKEKLPENTNKTRFNNKFFTKEHYELAAFLGIQMLRKYSEGKFKPKNDWVLYEEWLEESNISYNYYKNGDMNVYFNSNRPIYENKECFLAYAHFCAWCKYSGETAIPLKTYKKAIKKLIKDGWITGIEIPKTWNGNSSLVEIERKNREEKEFASLEKDIKDK